VYGINTEQPFSETDAVDLPASLYAVTKRSNELMAHSYAHLYNIPCTGLRFFTVYGPWGRPDMALFLFTKAILEQKPIDVFNYGEMCRDFTYIDDIIEGIVRIINLIPADHVPARVYNIGNGKPVRLLDFIQALEEELGIKAIKNMLPMQAGDVTATWADCSALERDTGYLPKIDIKEGIKRFVEWYRGFYEINNNTKKAEIVENKLPPPPPCGLFCISIVVPIFNEEENIALLYHEIKSVCERERYTYEIIFVDDGSTDKTADVANSLSPLKYIRMRRNFGQTAAMDAGIKNARYDRIITMDGDRQNDPEDIPRLINYMEENGFDIVSGWRKNRKDPLMKKIFSRTANLLRSIIVKDNIHDSGCSLKIYRKECFEQINLYGEMHRFIPALCKIKGYSVGEIVVNHRPRTAGITKYNYKRAFKGFVDMISLWFWGKYSSRPLHLFGIMGIVTFLASFLFGVTSIVLFIQRGKISDTGWLSLTSTFFLASIQLFIFGLMADIVSKTYRETTKDKSYNIKEIIETL
jgi:glycosyltransferase involved in cell wall biosynthesis